MVFTGCLRRGARLPHREIASPTGRPFQRRFRFRPGRRSCVVWLFGYTSAGCPRQVSDATDRSRHLNVGCLSAYRLARKEEIQHRSDHVRALEESSRFRSTIRRRSGRPAPTSSTKQRCDSRWRCRPHGRPSGRQRRPSGPTPPRSLRSQITGLPALRRIRIFAGSTPAASIS